MVERNPKNIKYFAKTNFRNQNQVFGIRTPEDMQYHCAVIGKTGSGKTHVLKSFIQNDIDNNRGFTCFDPHGDLISFVNERIPEHRKMDVVYLDIPNPEMSFGYNPLKKVSYEKRSLVASGILETFENLNGPNSWGPKLSHILRNCLLALLDYPEQTNFGDILRILRDKEFRKTCVKHIVNEDVKDYFVKEFPQYNPKFDFVPIYNKIGGFLSHPAIKRLLVDNRDNVSLRRVMDESKILLINVSKGAIGKDTARLIGSLLLTSIASAGFSRISMKEEERIPFTLYIDEAQVYANSSNVAEMLEELRKMKLILCLAFQHLSQLDLRLRDSLFSNIGNLIVFRTSAKDGEYLVKELFKDHMPFNYGDLVTAPKYHIIVRIMIYGQPSAPFTATTITYDDYF